MRRSRSPGHSGAATGSKPSAQVEVKVRGAREGARARLPCHPPSPRAPQFDVLLQYNHRAASTRRALRHSRNQGIGGPEYSRPCANGGGDGAVAGMEDGGGGRNRAGGGGGGRRGARAVVVARHGGAALVPRCQHVEERRAHVKIERADADVAAGRALVRPEHVGSSFHVPYVSCVIAVRGRFHRSSETSRWRPSAAASFVGGIYRDSNRRGIPRRISPQSSPARSPARRWVAWNQTGGPRGGSCCRPFRGSSKVPGAARSRGPTQSRTSCADCITSWATA